MPDLSVRVFQSTDSGAPALSGTAGALITLLDACLVHGYAAGGATMTLDSLTVTGNVATATKNPHGLTMLGAVGPVVRIAGATPAALNGDWRVTVTGAATFTFATTGIADGTATGTITAKRAPLGFSKAYAGTNKAAYQADDLLSSRMFLRIDDAGISSAAAYARVVGYEAMTDIDAGTKPFPTEAQQSGGGYWHKSNAANATARPWMIVGDSQGFYLLVQQDGSAANQIGMMFGDINSDHAGDAYRTLLVSGVNATASNGSSLQSFNSQSGHAMPRSYLGTGAAIQPIKYGAQLQAPGMGYAGATYPNPGNNAFLCSAVEVWDSASVARGTLPGLYAPLHPASSLTDHALQTAIAGLPGRTLLVKRLVYGAVPYACAVDITGPWR